MSSQTTLAQLINLINTSTRESEALLSSWHNTGHIPPAIITQTMRTMHTIKGLATMCHLPEAAQLAHSYESVMSHIATHTLPLTHQIISFLSNAHVALMNAAKPGATNVPQKTVQIQQAVDALIAHAPTQQLFDLNALGLEQSDSNQLSANEKKMAAHLFAAGKTLACYRAHFTAQHLEQQVIATTNKITINGSLIATVATGSHDHNFDYAFMIIFTTDLTLQALCKQADRPGSITLIKKNSPPQTESIINKELVLVTRSKIDRLFGLYHRLLLSNSTLLKIFQELEPNALPPEKHSALHKELLDLEATIRQCQQALLSTQLERVETITNNLEAFAQQLAQQHHKKIVFVIIGKELEIDQNTLNELNNTLMHLIKNAIAHGIETEHERQKIGKPAHGTLTLTFQESGNKMIVTLTDDGKGLNQQRIREKIVTEKFTSAANAAQLSDQELFQFIFHPGFTTTEQLSLTSGRGIGMDAVKNSIISLQGEITVTSEHNRGTTFVITLPTK